MSGKKNQDNFTKLVISESHLLFKWDLFFKIFKNFSGRQKISSDICGKSLNKSIHIEKLDGFVHCFITKNIPVYKFVLE